MSKSIVQESYSGFTMIRVAGCSEPPVLLKLLPARNHQAETAELWLRYSVFLYTFVPKLMVCNVVDNMPVTLFEMYVETE